LRVGPACGHGTRIATKTENIDLHSMKTSAKHEARHLARSNGTSEQLRTHKATPGLFKAP
jgi:hypothetical protein